ncbi:hypothetical protein KIW84_050126 [Lathyrus oleraceus]|uniref:CCHC-type domain-containing protein n=1 Tax=Pisum sativum TaxID=3888 RepID=A0A9D4WKC7_PEA|nr:hypothetical protein KIW84_050126 [Pisum sativum]
MRRLAITVGKQDTWHVIVQMTPFAMCAMFLDIGKQCPKSHIIGDHSGRGSFRGGGYCDVACRNCQQLGHMSRDCMGPLMICHNCGGRGHFAYERPSGRFVDRCPSDRYHPGRRY